MTKAARKGAPARKSRGGTLVGMFIGLVLGVVLCAGVMWYINGAALPLQVRDVAPAQVAPGGEPAPLPGKPGDKVPPKPRFDFYQILPGGQTVQPPKGSETAPPAATAEPAMQPEPPAARHEALILQAGAFSSEEEADNLRARLALIGLESSVQPHAVEGRATLYRVRLGPFPTEDDLKRVRADLAQNGIEASIVR